MKINLFTILTTSVILFTAATWYNYSAPKSRPDGVWRALMTLISCGGLFLSSIGVLILSVKKRKTQSVALKIGILILLLVAATTLARFFVSSTKSDYGSQILSFQNRNPIKEAMLSK